MRAEWGCQHGPGSQVSVTGAVPDKLSGGQDCGRAKGSSGCKRICSRAQLTETHYSPNRAATQVSMKYRVKRNQCQDPIHKPNQHSRSGQKKNRVIQKPTSGQRQKRHNPVHMPSQPLPNSQDSHTVSMRYKVIPSDKRARTTPEKWEWEQGLRIPATDVWARVSSCDPAAT